MEDNIVAIFEFTSDFLSALLLPYGATARFMHRFCHMKIRSSFRILVLQAGSVIAYLLLLTRTITSEEDIA